MAESAARPDRTLLAILCVIAALVIVALAALFLRSAPKPLDPASPAGVVQLYAAAVIEGDRTAAAKYLAAGSQSGCEPSTTSFTDSVRVTLISTTERTDSATVRVSVTITFDSGPFGTNEQETEEIFNLVKAANGEWRIAAAPWPLAICPASKLAP